MFSSLLSSPVTKRHVERKLIQTFPLHLFEIVCDVDKYAQFLPLCTESKVLRRFKKLENNDDEWMEAQLTVGLPPFFTERYVSRVRMIRTDLIIETQSIQSKWLDSLSSRWKLTPILPKSPLLPTPNSTTYNENDSNSSNLQLSSTAESTPLVSSQQPPTSCWVDFSVEITVSDPLVVNALDHVLRQVAGQQVAAFEQRCRQIPVPPHLLMHQATHK